MKLFNDLRNCIAFCRNSIASSSKILDFQPIPELPAVAGSPWQWNITGESCGQVGCCGNCLVYLKKVDKYSPYNRATPSCTSSFADVERKLLCKGEKPSMDILDSEDQSSSWATSLFFQSTSCPPSSCLGASSPPPSTALSSLPYHSLFRPKSSRECVQSRC